MITARMVGRVARDSKVSANEYGKFVSFELNMFDYYKGQNYITWVSVYSNKEKHISLVEQLIKGKLILVEGTLNLSIHRFKNRNTIQISVNADYIQIVNG